MSFCPKCGHDTADDDRFCRACGATLDPVVAGAAVPSAPSPTASAGHPGAPRPRKSRRVLVVVALVQVVAIGAIVFFVSGKGCSSTEGSFVASGGPLGDFTFTPTRCGSGQRMNFHGVILVGDGPTDGGVLVIEDAVRGKLIKVEVPGSCQPPDHEVCKEIEVTPAICSTFDMKVERTNTTVNDIRLLDGHVRVDCAFPEGGTLRGDVVFESCD